MQKQKQYSWKDTNMALFGSDLDRQVKKESAELEPAWKPVQECQKPKLFIWRIEKFKVVAWPEDLYGKFFDGDSYIVLNVYKQEDKLLYDIHFWIGKHSTADEYGTAAYKTVELDTLMDDVPVQHREVQSYESDLFKSYFKEITYMTGGCPSGFRKVQTREYTPRLFHFKGERRSIVIKEVSRSKKCLDDTDVYILDLGDRAYQWNSQGCNKDERFKAAEYLKQLQSERNGRLKVSVVDQNDDAEFMCHLTEEVEEDESAKHHSADSKEKMLFKLSDESGKLEFSKLEKSSTTLSKNLITENDAYIIDNGFEIYVYIGKDASPEERKNALSYAHNYLIETPHPFLPVTVVNHNAPASTKSKMEANLS